MGKSKVGHQGQEPGGGTNGDQGPEPLGTKGGTQCEAKAGTNGNQEREPLGNQGREPDRPQRRRGTGRQNRWATRGGEGQGARTRPEPRGATAGAGFSN